MSIAIDIAEPQKIVDLLRQSAEVDVLPLNINDFADYTFIASNGVMIQIERERASTILTQADSTEDEIRRHLHDESVMILLIEGVLIPYADGCVVVELAPNYQRTMHVSKTRYETAMAWLWQIQENKIEYINTCSLEASAIAIASIYHNAQKLEHHTFRRYYKPIISWHPNQHIHNLMALKGAEIGEKKATALTDHFKTYFNAITASEEELYSILGLAGTMKLLKAVGRR